MATFTNRKGRITAQFRKVGPDGQKRSFSRTFGTMEEATEWASSAEQVLNKVGATLPAEVALLPRYSVESSCVGVYFLFSGQECVYVGQSKNVHVRVREHRATKNGAKSFDSYSFLPVPEARLSKVEFHYINLLRPRYNTALNPITKLERRSRSKRITSKEAALLRAQVEAERCDAVATRKNRHSKFSSKSTT